MEIVQETLHGRGRQRVVDLDRGVAGCGRDQLPPQDVDPRRGRTHRGRFAHQFSKQRRRIHIPCNGRNGLQPDRIATERLDPEPQPVIGIR